MINAIVEVKSFSFDDNESVLEELQQFFKDNIWDFIDCLGDLFYIRGDLIETGEEKEIFKRLVYKDNSYLSTPDKFILFLVPFAFIQVIRIWVLIPILAFIPHTTLKQQKLVLFAVFASAITSHFDSFMLTLLGTFCYINYIFPYVYISHSAITEALNSFLNDIKDFYFVSYVLHECTLGLRIINMIGFYLFLRLFLTLENYFTSHLFYTESYENRTRRSKEDPARGLKMVSNDQSPISMHSSSVSNDDPALLIADTHVTEQIHSAALKPTTGVVCSLFAVFIPAFVLAF